MFIVAILLLFLITTSAFSIFASFPVNANSNNLNTIIVPISWCAVKGSESVTNPIIPGLNEAGQITIDDVLNHRLDLVNNHILNQANIVLINTLDLGFSDLPSIPIISDPDTSIGRIGNISYFDALSSEVEKLVTECTTLWKESVDGGELYGIPVINFRNYVFDDGSIDFDLLGESFCELNASTGFCESPYFGEAFVVDMQFTLIGGTGGINTDPVDQNLAHEIGHALGLSHVDNPDLLMHNSQQEEPNSGTVYNILLTDDEIVTIRGSALSVLGTHQLPN